MTYDAILEDRQADGFVASMDRSFEQALDHSLEFLETRDPLDVEDDVEAFVEAETSKISDPLQARRSCGSVLRGF